MNKKTEQTNTDYAERLGRWFESLEAKALRDYAAGLKTRVNANNNGSVSCRNGVCVVLWRPLPKVS
jgi:hypothetical protein